MIQRKKKERVCVNVCVCVCVCEREEREREFTNESQEILAFDYISIPLLSRCATNAFLVLH